jgi:prolyl-tRNA synthetase
LAKASNIQFLNKNNELQLAFTTSWGVSTRLIGGLIMTHSDDDGLVLPPRISPTHIVIIPVYKEDRDEILNYCNNLKQELSKQMFHERTLQVHIDDRDIRGGEKTWQWVKKGVPLRIEIGARDIQNNNVFLARRDIPPQNKQSIPTKEFINNAVNILNEIQINLFTKALRYRDENSFEVSSLDEFKKIFDKNGSAFVKCYALDDPIIEPYIKPLQVTARVIPLTQTKSEGLCIFSGQKTNQKMIFAKSY